MLRPSPSLLQQFGMTSAAGFGALPWRPGQAQEGSHSPLQPPSPGLFLASVYLNRGCCGWAVGRGWTGTSKEAIGLVRLAWHTAELGRAGGGTSCLTQVHTFGCVEGIGGCRIWSHEGSGQASTAGPVTFGTRALSHVQSRPRGWCQSRESTGPC